MVLWEEMIVKGEELLGLLPTHIYSPALRQGGCERPSITPTEVSGQVLLVLPYQVWVPPAWGRCLGHIYVFVRSFLCWPSVPGEGILGEGCRDHGSELRDISDAGESQCLCFALGPASGTGPGVPQSVPSPWDTLPAMEKIHVWKESLLGDASAGSLISDIGISN